MGSSVSTGTTVRVRCGSCTQVLAVPLPDGSQDGDVQVACPYCSHVSRLAVTSHTAGGGGGGGGGDRGGGGGGGDRGGGQRRGGRGLLLLLLLRLLLLLHHHLLAPCGRRRLPLSLLPLGRLVPARPPRHGRATRAGAEQTEREDDGERTRGEDFNLRILIQGFVSAAS